VLHRQPIDLATLVSIDRPPVGARVNVLGRIVTSRGVSVELIEFPAADRVWLPAWLYRPAVPESSPPLLVLLEPTGRNAHWREGELYHELALAGYCVCVPDLRGIGDLAPRFGAGYPPYARLHQEEEQYAWSSLILGKPLLGQRVTDILAVMTGLRGDRSLRSGSIRLAAAGELTVPALFATAMDPNIEDLYLAAPLVSYRSIVETENYRTSFACFLPGVLAHTDLPDVAASLAPRRICLAGAVDAAGTTMDIPDVRKIYRAHNVTVFAEAKWDRASLSARPER
jgi:hypothetical protein